MKQLHLIFTASFNTWSAFRAQLPLHLEDSEKVFIVEMGQQVVKHCQDKGTKFYRLIKKKCVPTGFKFADLNGLSHRFNREKKLAGKDW
jgi:hypothetical protein